MSTVTKTLDEWCVEERGRQKYLAEQLEISYLKIKKMRNGTMDVSPLRSVQIERLTKGEVPRQSTRPDDWFEYWPELPGASEMLEKNRKIQYGRRASDVVKI